jgi:positive regulator of sigma E activity
MASERSYSDREVSLVLRRAAEIESTDGGTSAAAESDILAIADEAGISREAVHRALEELAADAGVTGSSFFPPSSRRTSRRVDGRLDREALSALVQAIEDRVGRPGAVAEALDTVRWTAKSSLATTQVSLSASGGETRVGVHERVNDRARRVMYILPVNLLAMGAMITAGSLGLATAPMLAILGGGAVVGLGVGRIVSRRFSAASQKRVEQLATELAESARRLSSPADGRLPEDPEE